MARIEINDLSQATPLDRDTARRIVGGMFPAFTKSGGPILGFPDICRTPTGAVPTPIPYPTPAPNIGSATGSGSKMFGRKNVGGIRPSSDS
jgi:hypothetical protein